MPLPRERRQLAGPPIAPTYRQIATLTNPGTALDCNVTLTTVGPELFDRTLVVFGKLILQTVSALYFCGQQLEVRYVPAADAAGNLWFMATGVIPKNVGGALVVHSNGGSNTGTCYIYTVAGLASPVPIDRNFSSAATDTVRTIDLNTKAGGLILAVAFNNVTAGQSCAWTGDQTTVKNAENLAGGVFSTAHVVNTNEDATNTITATYAVISTTSCSLIGASFR